MKNPNAFSVVLAIMCACFSISAPGAQCPDNIESGDCVANDLQPTGTEIIEGPDSCTLGETFSAKVRVLFENGGGANTRFSVGFFVGQNGQPAIGGGDNCFFDSLQPVGDPIDLTGGEGGFQEFNGDQCGDIARQEPTYKDLQLDSILCKDEDGDGNVDLGYVLSWVNNGNRENCTDPLDANEFLPEAPKCLADLEYNLPIVVERDPQIEVSKSASPGRVIEPGGDVIYSITIINTSPSASDPVTITSIVDEPYGDITERTDCEVPFKLAQGQSKTCNFTGAVSGVAGESFTDTVTVSGVDDEGELVSATDDATVDIVDPGDIFGPGELHLSKFVSPASLPEPGGIVRYHVVANNPTQTEVVLTEMVDDLYGDLNGKGNCALPQTLIGLSSQYACSFVEEVSGQPGDVITDTITATGFDRSPLGTALTSQASASVQITNLGSKIKLTKLANPETVPEPGDIVQYTLTIQNLSSVDEVTISNLLDTEVGGTPGGDCALPVVLAPAGGTYSCTYTWGVNGNADDTVTNIVTARGRDDDDQPVADIAAASVFIVGPPPSIEVSKTALPPVALASGSKVIYLVHIVNTSSASNPVTITSLTDNVNGSAIDLNGEGTCDLDLENGGLLLQPSPAPGSQYWCYFEVDPQSGPAGTTLTDTVIASGTNEAGISVTGSDDATVRFIEGPILGEAGLKVVKVASPAEVHEPGGDVNYTVALINTSEPALVNPDLIITALTDEVEGVITDLDGFSSCDLPLVIPIHEFRICTFQSQVTGPVDTTVLDTVTAMATYGGEGQLAASADAEVKILDTPSSISVVKRADPSKLTEPGGPVTFSIEVVNSSQVDAITIDSLTDNIHGDLNGQGDCATPFSLQAGDPPYTCAFTAELTEQGGTTEVNTVTASGIDDDGKEVSGTDQASVTILDMPPVLSVTKRAVPDFLVPPGEPVLFLFTAINQSVSDAITLETLQDSVFGDLNGRGTCSVPQELAAGDTYECEFEAYIEGASGDTHSDQIEASGVSDDDDPVSASAQAIVRFAKIVTSIPVAGQAGLAVLVLLMIIIGMQAVRGRY